VTVGQLQRQLHPTEVCADVDTSKSFVRCWVFVLTVSAILLHMHHVPSSVSTGAAGPAVAAPVSLLNIATEASAALHLRVTAALLYGLCSLAIVFSNKIVLTTLAFPSFQFIAIAQCVCTMIVLVANRTLVPLCTWYLSRLTAWTRQTITGRRAEDLAVSRQPPVTVAEMRRSLMDLELSWRTVKAVQPLPLLFMLNVLCGLGATKHLNVPTFVLLRRFSIPMTMGLEWVLLSRAISRQVAVSVFLMVVGACVAAAGDGSHSWQGYVFILLNDVATALQGVMLRRKMDQSNAAGAALTSDGIMFMNSALSLPFMITVFYATPGELKATILYPKWSSPIFILAFGGSMLLGYVLTFSMFLCTKVNSPLTTSVVGSIKNVISSYLGMFMQDYRFSWGNFIGVNISVVAAVIYSHAEVAKLSASKKSAAAGRSV
jgi:solute carrier family 35 protein